MRKKSRKHKKKKSNTAMSVTSNTESINIYFNPEDGFAEEDESYGDQQSENEML